MFDFLRNLTKSAAEKRYEAITAYLDGALSSAARTRFEARSWEANLNDWQKQGCRRSNLPTLTFLIPYFTTVNPNAICFTPSLELEDLTFNWNAIGSRNDSIQSVKCFIKGNMFNNVLDWDFGMFFFLRFCLFFNFPPKNENTRARSRKCDV